MHKMQGKRVQKDFTCAKNTMCGAHVDQRWKMYPVFLFSVSAIEEGKGKKDFASFVLN